VTSSMVNVHRGESLLSTVLSEANDDYVLHLSSLLVHFF